MLVVDVIAGFMGGIGMPLYQVALAMAGFSLAAVVASLVADHLIAEPLPRRRGCARAQHRPDRGIMAGS